MVPDAFSGSCRRCAHPKKWSQARMALTFP
jgi:hypothetical protein